MCSIFVTETSLAIKKHGLLPFFFLPMPAAAASRVNTDIAELNVLDTTPSPVLPGQPTDTDEPPKPLENGKPRRCAEFVMAATTVIFIPLLMVPKSLKKGQMWYTVAQSLVLVNQHPH